MMRRTSTIAERLLRGRGLYVVLGLWVVGLLAWHAAVKPPAREPVQEGAAVFPTPVDGTPMRWTTAPDAVALERALAQDRGFALLVTVLSVVIVGMIVGGCVFSAWALWRGRFRPLWRLRSRWRPPWTVGELVRIMILVVTLAVSLAAVHQAITTSPAGWAIDPHVWLTASMLALDAFVVFAIAAFASGRGRTLQGVFGLSVQRVRTSVAIGLRSYVTLFPWLVALLALAVTVAQWVGFEPPVEPIHELMFEEERPLVLGLTSLLACLVGPLAEELLFRGVLYGAVRRHASALAAIVISGSVFAAFHTNVIGFFPIMALGCLLAYVYERSGSLAGPFAVHVVHNTLLMSVALAFRRVMAVS